jgi:hypothetical protein
MVEAPDHHGMAQTSTPYICKVFATIPILLVSCAIHHIVITITLVGSDLKFQPKSWIAPELQIIGRCHG